MALRALCQKERYQKTFTIVRSLPGIGWFSAIRLVLELGEDLSRFHQREEDRELHGTHLERVLLRGHRAEGAYYGYGAQGSFRSMLVENSWAAIRKDPVLLAKFSRIWRSSGSKKKAIVGVARMLIVRLRACVLSNTPYMQSV